MKKTLLLVAMALLGLTHASAQDVDDLEYSTTLVLVREWVPPVSLSTLQRPSPPM